MQTEARVGGVVVDGGRAVAAARRPEQQQQTHIGTAAHLAAGGLAGVVSKTCTAPLARLTILFQVEDISSVFPFAISEKEELTEITLTRSLKTEQIEVLVSVPKLAQDVKDDEGLLSPSKEDQEDEGKTPPEKYSLPIRVTVSKADGSGLVFTCTAKPDDIVIEGLSIRRKPLGAKEGDAVTYEEGPDFRELDKSVQETFHKYLELRGITPKNTRILHEYMISKDRRVFPKAESKDTRKNLAFLTKLCGFIKKN